MSHRVTIKSQVRTTAILKRGVEWLRARGREIPEVKFVEKYHMGVDERTNQPQYSTGQAVWLQALPGEPRWTKPVIFDMAAGTLAMDNWGGRWGNIERLHELLRRCAAETILEEAQERGDLVEEREVDGVFEVLVHHS